jgi:hypothetical protein
MGREGERGGRVLTHGGDESEVLVVVVEVCLETSLCEKHVEVAEVAIPCPLNRAPTGAQIPNSRPGRGWGMREYVPVGGRYGDQLRMNWVATWAGIVTWHRDSEGQSGTEGV